MSSLAVLEVDTRPFVEHELNDLIGRMAVPG